MVEISRIIAQDPALTGNLLRIANSPMYRVSSLPVESIDRAVTLVGVQGIRSIIATALAAAGHVRWQRHFSRFPELVWEHTLYSASAAEMHAIQIEKIRAVRRAARRPVVRAVGDRGVSDRARSVRRASTPESESRQHRAHAGNLGGAHGRPDRGELGVVGTRAVRAREPDAGRRTADGKFAGPFAEVRAGRRFGHRAVPAGTHHRGGSPGHRAGGRKPPAARSSGSGNAWRRQSCTPPTESAPPDTATGLVPVHPLQ